MKPQLCLGLAVVVVVVVVAIAGSTAQAEDVPNEVQFVDHLTNSNFHEYIKNNTYVFVKFYAPWCGHCKTFAAEYEETAKELAKDKPHVKLAKMDATAETEIAEVYKVHGYPTLKFFRNGEPIDYTEKREKATIIKWITKKIGPAVATINTIEEGDEFIKNNPTTVFGFFKNAEMENAKSYIDAAGNLDNFAFAMTSNEAVMKKYAATDGQIVLMKPHDEEREVFTGEITKQNIEKFCQVKSLPLIVNFNHESASQIFGGFINTHLLFFISKADGHMEKHIEPLKEVAKEFREHIIFVTISSDEEDHGRIFEFFGMKKEETPTYRLIKLEDDMAKYRPESNDMSSAAIRDFLNRFLDGKLKQHLLSQDLPEDWDKHPVKVLTSSNFDKVVFDKTKDVLVEFYAPWCGHCKQLVPIYEELGENFKDNDTVVIAKMDSTANELEHTKISSFPTIKFYRKGDNAVKEYTDDRTLEKLVKFITSGGDSEKPTEMDDATKEESSEEEEHVKDEL